jgi:peptidoglycan biosynthesis protein MviN/MurJ (putative lipid II flippase)
MGGASLAMCLVLWALMYFMTGWLDWVWYERAFYLSILCFSGITTYFAVLFASGMRWSDFHIQME